MSRFDTYKFRCSALGSIVSKSGKFTEGNRTYIEECFIGEVYGVRKEAYGKALEKGIACEEDGITMLKQVFFPDRLILKNRERRYNDFIHGEADVIKDAAVFDIKNAYDLFSFGKADLTHEYKWQLIGYMWLWGVKKAVLFYCLNNMPEHMLLEEERKLFYTHKFKYTSMEDTAYLKDVEAMRKLHHYDHIPLEEKFKYWELELTDEVEQLKQSVTQARNYMNQLWEEHQMRIEKNRVLMNQSVLV